MGTKGDNFVAAGRWQIPKFIKYGSIIHCVTPQTFSCIG